MDLSLPYENQVAIAGDWHGNISWVQKAISALARAAPGVKTVLHVGDFWFNRSIRGRSYLNAVDYCCERAGIARVLVTPGNHEDWNWLDEEFLAMPGLPVPVSPFVSVLPRGFRFTLSGRFLMSFGGAASVDYSLRSVGVDWWLTEVPTDEDVATAIAAGPVDVLLTHDTVNGGTTATETLLRSNPMGWSAEALLYSGLSRERVTHVWNAVDPKLLLHGHMHVADQIILADGRQVISLDRDERDKNMGLLNLGTLGWEWISGVGRNDRVRRSRNVEAQYLNRPIEMDN